MVTWLRRCDVSEVRFLPIPWRADVLETGDIGSAGCRVGEPRQADALCGSTSAVVSHPGDRGCASAG